MFDKLFRAAKLLNTDKRLFKNLVSKAGSITSLELLISLKSHCNIFSTIIDVGANIGQFALAASFIYPEAKIFSFEAIPELNSSLKMNLKKVRNIEILNCALGGKDGIIKFYQGEYTHISSALKPIDSSLKVHEIEVEVKKLDSVFSNKSIDHPVLLKLDVQGFEKEVLEGSKKLLEKIDYIVMEVSFARSYENEPLFTEMNEYLNAKGFLFVAPVDILRTKNYQIIQVDALYKRI